MGRFAPISWCKDAQDFPPLPSQRRTVTFCHRGNCIQAALGIICCETCEATAFAYGKKKKICSFFMVVAQWPFILPGPVHLKVVFVLLYIDRQQLLPQDSSYCPHLPFPFNSREQRGFRMRGKAGQSLRREESENFLAGTLPLRSPTTTRAEGGRAG